MFVFACTHTQYFGLCPHTIFFNANQEEDIIQIVHDTDEWNDDGDDGVIKIQWKMYETIKIPVFLGEHFEDTTKFK